MIAHLYTCYTCTVPALTLPSPYGPQSITYEASQTPTYNHSNSRKKMSVLNKVIIFLC